MTMVLIGVGGWFAAVGFLCCLGRSAAVGDAEALRDSFEAESVRGRLGAREERRAAPRPPHGPSADRRREDASRRQVEEAEGAEDEAEDAALLEALGY